MKITVETTVAAPMVSATFDAETENSVEQQRAGWQAIMDNFAKHVEAATA